MNNHHKERKELLNCAKSYLNNINAAVELGVAAGEHAVLIRDILKPNMLYLVDAWGRDPAYAELTREVEADFLPALQKTQIFRKRNQERHSGNAS